MTIIDKSFKIACFTALGVGLEYYDFVIYGTMATYLGDIFFSKQNELSNDIQVFSAFAVGYLIRPFGGTIIGMIADTYGRKNTFTISMFTMALSTIIIGLLPTYAEVGIISSIGLLSCRICQGISFGAELPGATTIVTEFAPKNKLGKLCGLILSSTSIGALLAISMLALLTNLFTYNEIITGLWRIPFILGGILAIVSYCIRQNISETPEFLQEKQRHNNRAIIMPFKLLCSQHISKMIIGFGMSFFLATMVIINLYFPTYINKYFDYELADIYNAIAVSMVTSMIFVLIFGWVSDHTSKLKILLFALINYGILLFPLFQLLSYKTFWALQLFFIFYQLAIAIFFTSYLPILSNLFTTNVRYTGIAFVYNIAFSVASLIPLISSYLLEKYQLPSILKIFFIIAIVVAIGSVIALIIQDKSGASKFFGNGTKKIKSTERF